MNDRVACRRCTCEIGFGPNPEQRIATRYKAGDETGVSHHAPKPDEPPLQFDRACLCSCHEVWHQMYGSNP